MTLELQTKVDDLTRLVKLKEDELNLALKTQELQALEIDRVKAQLLKSENEIRQLSENLQNQKSYSQAANESNEKLKIALEENKNLKDRLDQDQQIIENLHTANKQEALNFQAMLQKEKDKVIEIQKKLRILEEQKTKLMANSKTASSPQEPTSNNSEVESLKNKLKELQTTYNQSYDNLRNQYLKNLEAKDQELNQLKVIITQEVARTKKILKEK